MSIHFGTQFVIDTPLVGEPNLHAASQTLKRIARKQECTLVDSRNRPVVSRDLYDLGKAAKQLMTACCIPAKASIARNKLHRLYLTTNTGPEQLDAQQRELLALKTLLDNLKTEGQSDQIYSSYAECKTDSASTLIELLLNQVERGKPHAEPIVYLNLQA